MKITDLVTFLVNKNGTFIPTFTADFAMKWLSLPDFTYSCINCVILNTCLSFVCQCSIVKSYGLFSHTSIPCFMCQICSRKRGS